MIALHNALLVAGVVAALLGLAWAAASDIVRYEIPHRACALVGAGYLLAGLGAPLGPWLGGLAVGATVFATPGNTVPKARSASPNTSARRPTFAVAATVALRA